MQGDGQVVDGVAARGGGGTGGGGQGGDLGEKNEGYVHKWFG